MQHKQLLKQISSVGLMFLLLAGCTAAPTVLPTATVDPNLPVAGGFQGGNMYLEGSISSFNLVLVVSKDHSDTIDGVFVTCAPRGEMAGSNPVTIATNVKLNGTSFIAESEDVVIEGQFTSSTKAEGSIRAISENAKGCGVPEDGPWESVCNLSVEIDKPEESSGGLVITGMAAMTDFGKAYTMVRVPASNDAYFVLKEAESGPCAQP